MVLKEGIEVKFCFFERMAVRTKEDENKRSRRVGLYRKISSGTSCRKITDLKKKLKSNRSRWYEDDLSLARSITHDRHVLFSSSPVN